MENIELEKAFGPDGIPNICNKITMKSCVETVASYIVILFTKLLGSGLLPDDWKSETLVPIQKTLKNSVENFWLIPHE